jgi:hypothetical protein
MDALGRQPTLLENFDHVLEVVEMAQKITLRLRAAVNKEGMDGAGGRLFRGSGHPILGARAEYCRRDERHGEGDANRDDQGAGEDGQR